MAPYQKAENGYGDAGKSHELVAENILSSHVGDKLAYYTHGGQDHDVDRRVRVEPEEVLKQNRIASERRVEYAYLHRPLKRQHQDGHGDDGRSQYHYQARRVM